MNFKNWVKYLIIFNSLLYLFFYLSYFLINPMQEFKYSLIENKYFYNKNYSRKQFKELNRSKNTLVFGTSQIHLISSKMLHKNVLNLHNLYGESGDILNFLRQLDKKQLSNIDDILCCIDLASINSRMDTDFINYSDRFELSGLDYKKLNTTYLTLKYNLQSKQDYFLNEDGSIVFLNNFNGTTIHQNLDASYFSYNIATLNEIIEINNICTKNNIKINFFTPVANDMSIMGVNFDNEIKNIFSTLLDGGIRKIKILYYIDGISNYKKRGSNYYPAFRDSRHISPIYFKYVLYKYILNEDHQYSITNKRELDNYIDHMKKIQIDYTKQ